MNSIVKLLGKIAFLAVLLVAVFISCGDRAAQDSGAGKLNVVTTIGMIADVADNIGGEVVNVTSLMGPGVDPHLYKASEGDVSRLMKADVILFNGLHLEAKMGKVLEKLESRKVVKAVTDNIDREGLLGHLDYEDTFDPHVWFDVSKWKQVAETIKDVLSEADPGNKETYATNFSEYAAKMDALQSYVEERIAEVPVDSRTLITAHDAFRYFGKAYGFDVMGLQGISTVTEAGTGDVQNLAELIAEKKIKAIFIESSVPRKSVEALQAAVKSRGFDVEIGGELFSDAMGDPNTEEGTYLGMVKHNVDTIVDALK